MADAVTVTLTGSWHSFQKAIDPDEFRKRLHANLTIANGRIGKRFQRRARRAIRAKEYEPNSPITVILKGASTPLVGGGPGRGPGGDLFQGLTYHSPDPTALQLGIQRMKSGDEVVNIGLILHEGATIDVGAHPKVRTKVWAMVSDALKRSGALNAKSKQAVLEAAGGLSPKEPGSKPKDLWVIPGRAFIMDPIDDGHFGGMVRKEIERAVANAFKGS